MSRGEILRPPENSVPQTIVFRNKEIGDNCLGSIEKKFLSKYSLDRNNIIASPFRTQHTPDFLIAEYYGLQNTVFWVTEDLASAGLAPCSRTRAVVVVRCKLPYCSLYRLPVDIGEEIVPLVNNIANYKCREYWKLKARLLAANGRSRWDKLDSLLTFPKMGGQ
jgi:hypothetical protein